MGFEVSAPVDSFQPTRPLRGATPAHQGQQRIGQEISTHAPLAGRDKFWIIFTSHSEDFNPRAPCGARRESLHEVFISRKFQPTRPLRGATGAKCRRNRPHGFQPTRPLRGATEMTSTVNGLISISTHAPLAGRDSALCKQSLGGFISTHAPLAGRDRTPPPAWNWPRYFNPRAPCGARRGLDLSIPYRENDFNPRAPCGARRKGDNRLLCGRRISTHAPLAGRDPRASFARSSARRISTHAPLAGRDLRHPCSEAQGQNFNPRAPCGARPFLCPCCTSLL